MWLGLHKAQHLHHPVWKWFGYIPAVPEIQVPAETLGDGDLVGLHKLNQGTIGVFHIGKMAGGLAHIEGFSGGVDVRIHSKGEAFLGALLLQGLHIKDVKA